MNLFLRYCLFIFSFYFSVNIYSQTKGTVLFDSLNSNILNHINRFTVYIPPSHSNMQNKKYPVIYMLHGFGGNENDWLFKGNINNIMDSLINNKIISKAVIVMPAARNSYYMNNYNNTCMYEDFIIKEFIPYIEYKYDDYIIDTARTIAGLSMGGFGAVLFAVKYPGKFDMCIALSAAVRPPEIFNKLSTSKYKLLFSEVFDTSLTGNQRITEHWKNNSPYFLIDSNNADKLKNTIWYIECGLDDPLLPSNQAFHHLLLKHNIEHEYIERKGNHNWDFWLTGITKALVYREKTIRTKESIP